MAVHVRTPAAATYTVAPPPDFAITCRPPRPDEFPYLTCTWAEGYKTSPTMRRKTWADYKALHAPALRQILASRDTSLLVADGAVPGHAIGWLAWTRWPSVDIVHWAYTAKPSRRRGVLTALLEAAGVRRNIVYTHRAGTQSGIKQADEVIAERLRAHGCVVSHIPYSEWSK